MPVLFEAQSFFKKKKKQRILKNRTVLNKDFLIFHSEFNGLTIKPHEVVPEMEIKRII